MRVEAALTVFASNLQVSRDFYEGSLGFEVEDVAPDTFLARRDGLELQVEGGARPRKRGRRWMEEAGVLINLRTDDFAALYDDLEARGVDFLGGVTEAADGSRFAGFSDPDGNLFELSELS